MDIYQQKYELKIMCGETTESINISFVIGKDIQPAVRGSL